MNINFKTRDAARKFANKRKASGYPSKVVDNAASLYAGAKFWQGSRYSVCVDKRLASR